MHTEAEIGGTGHSQRSQQLPKVGQAHGSSKRRNLLPTMLLLCLGARHEEMASNSRTCKGAPEARSRNRRITGQSASPRDEAKETQVPEVFRSAPTGVWGDGSSWMSTYLSAKEQEDRTWVEKAKNTPKPHNYLKMHDAKRDKRKLRAVILRLQ